MKNTIPAEDINRALDAGHLALLEVTNFPHELNDEIQDSAKDSFTIVNCNLYPAGILIMYANCSYEFKKMLSEDVPTGMHDIFCGIFLTELMKLSGVEEEYNSVEKGIKDYKEEPKEYGTWVDPAGGVHSNHPDHDPLKQYE